MLGSTVAIRLPAIAAVYAVGAGSSPAADMYFSYCHRQQHWHAIYFAMWHCISRYSGPALGGNAAVAGVSMVWHAVHLYGQANLNVGGDS